MKIFDIQPFTKTVADFTQQWVIFLHSRRLFGFILTQGPWFMVAPPSGTFWACVVQGREEQRISHWGLTLSPRWLLPLSLCWQKQVARGAPPCAQEESNTGKDCSHCSFRKVKARQASRIGGGGFWAVELLSLLTSKFRTYTQGPSAWEKL